MADRSPEDIQREIEQARVTLADAVDQIAYRTSPKRLSEQVKQSLKEKAQSTQGRVVIGATGVLVVLLVVRRVRKR
jgi:hypothetical protein